MCSRPKHTTKQKKHDSTYHKHVQQKLFFCNFMILGLPREITMLVLKGHLASSKWWTWERESLVPCFLTTKQWQSNPWAFFLILLQDKTEGSEPMCSVFLHRNRELPWENPVQPEREKERSYPWPSLRVLVLTMSHQERSVKPVKTSVLLHPKQSETERVSEFYTGSPNPKQQATLSHLGAVQSDITAVIFWGF